MKKCGYATIIGKTNLGKSTFLNNFLDKKIPIAAELPVSNPPQVVSTKTT